MSHEITRTDTALFAGRPAWHGLGIVVPEALDPQETLKVAGLDWKVEKRPLFAGTFTEGWGEDGPTKVASVEGAREVTSHAVTHRSDTGQMLGVVGAEYSVLQNRELFELMERVSQQADVRVESAASLRSGRVVFALVKGAEFTLPGDDRMQTFTLWSTSHDGSAALRVLPTSVRVVCANTLSMALSGRDAQGIAVRHTSGMDAQVVAAIEALRRGEAQGEKFREAAEALAARPINRAEVEEFFTDVYLQALGRAIPAKPKNKREEAVRVRAVETIGGWMDKLDRERNRLDGVTTAWSALNVVTEWSDHERPTRATASSGDEDERRTFSRLLGSGAAAKTKALGRALQLIH